MAARACARAVEHVNGEIRDAVVGLDGDDQRGVDAQLCALDGTENKGRLGANAILGVSLATAKAVADEAALPLYRYVGGVNAHVLPVPLMNVVNGGAHADSNVDIQEFMLAPVGAVTFAEALRWGAETYHVLHALLKERGLETGLGDEGGFAPNLPSNEEACKLLVARDRARRLPARRGDRARPRHRFERVLRERPVRARRRRPEVHERRVRGLPRGPRARDTRSCRSRTAWPKTTGTAGRSSPRRLGIASSWSATTSSSPTPSDSAAGIDLGVANSILVKVNQIGTLTETLDTVQVASRAGYTAVMSHRSGETEDSTIADLAVATNCGQIKAGAPARSDRVAKYNQLLRIEEQLGETAAYLGVRAFAGGASR